MLLYKICLTGGPSGGKTTVISKLKEELEILGFRVFVIDETATRIINMGIKPFGDNKINYHLFEKKVIDLQIYEEECYDYCLKNIWKEPSILICDRGLIDPLAYISNNEYEMIINSKNLTKEDILKRYDLVVHLETAAKNKGYTKENNRARSEDEKEAIIKDNNTLDAWKEHHNLKLIKSYDNFDDKINEVKKVVLKEIIKNINIKEEKVLTKVIEIKNK